MGRPARRTRRGQPVAEGVSLQAPVGGWNARDPLSAMDPLDAVVLDNWFPETREVRLRGGYVAFSNDLGAPVETLFEYQAGATAAFLAAADGEIWDITSGTGVSLDSGFANDRWQHVTFTTTGGTFIIAVNGEDDPILYDGSAVSTAAITSVTGGQETLVDVMAYSGRLFFAQVNSLSLWYLDPLAIAGAASEYDVGAFCLRGGSVAALATWTRDNGFGGVDDLFVVFTTQGELLMFSGDDPGSSTAWQFLGRFEVGRPIGRRCVVRFGPELIIINEDGFVPLSRLLTVDRTQADAIAISEKIGNAVTQAARSFGTLFGWQGAIYPAGNMGVFNIPTSSTTSEQYVANTITGAWCRFTGQNAACWGLFNGGLYFGSPNGVVYRADTGANDDGVNIEADLQTAFTYPGGRGVQKRFTMVRPIFVTNGILTPSIGVLVDFDIRDVEAPVSSIATGTIWGQFTWGDALWGSTSQLQRNWVGVSGVGYAASLRFRVSTASVRVRFQSFDMLYERGAFL